MNSTENKNTIKELVDDITKSIPVIKNLLESVSIAINSGNFSEAIKLLNPAITTLTFISQIIYYLEKEVDKKELNEICINGERIYDIERQWVLKLEELRDSIRNNDIVKAGDIIFYELPGEIDKQIEIMNLLVNRN